MNTYGLIYYEHIWINIRTMNTYGLIYYEHLYYEHMVYIEKNAINVSPWHLKTQCHVRHFSSTCAPHFDGRAAVRHLVECRGLRHFLP